MHEPIRHVQFVVFLHESYSLVIFTVYRTNCCVLLLENFMLFWTSLSNLNGRLRAICLPFVEFFFLFLAFFLKLRVTYSPSVRHFVLLCFSDLPVNQFNFNSLHSISTFCTDVFSANKHAEIFSCLFTNRTISFSKLHLLSNQ